jgi:multicomponent Na+:H+ antiporter subunit G
MSEIQNILSIFFVVVGILFMFVGSVGNDPAARFLSRTHSVSKSDTIGIIFVISALSFMRDSPKAALNCF